MTNTTAAAPLSAEQLAYQRVREEFELAVKMGHTFCIDSAMLNVDALIAQVRAAQAHHAAATTDLTVVREAVAAAFEDRPGWRIKIAAAVRAIDRIDTSAATTTGEDARDAAPIISSYDIAKVKALKFQFVESLIHSGIQYRTCGAISAALNRIIDESEVAAMSAPNTIQNNEGNTNV